MPLLNTFVLTDTNGADQNMSVEAIMLRIYPLYLSRHNFFSLFLLFFHDDIMVQKLYP